MTLSPSPLFLGFTELLRDLADAENRKMDNYPPCNIIKLNSSGDRYLIQLAVAGFSDEELKVEFDPPTNKLTIYSLEDSYACRQENSPREYIHRGIALRSFKRTFTLAQHVEVVRTVLNDGILNITLERKLPENMKPIQIPIGK